MNIVVSKKKSLEESGFLRVETLKEADSVVGRIDCLVYHKSDETSEDKILYLNRLKSRVGNFIYVCNEKDTDMVIKMVITGLNGKYFDDEFFIESGNELYNLVNSLDEVTEIAELGGVSVLSDFLNRYLKNGSSNFSTGYLVVVKEAVQNLMSEYNQKNLEILQMSENATELFSNTAEILSAMKKEHGEMKKVINKLESDVKKNAVLAVQSNQASTVRRVPSLMFFPQVSYMKEKKIIRIKEIGDFRYLTSFMLGLRIYFETIKNVRPKLIFIEPIGEVYEKKYEDYSWVTQAKIKDKKYYYNNIVFTNCPNREVLTNLLDDMDYDTFIVIDRLKSSPTHVLNSKGSLYYAVSGKSSIDKFNLPVKNIISCVEPIKGSLFTVCGSERYPEEKSSRERFYLSEFSKEFLMLY